MSGLQSICFEVPGRDRLFNAFHQVGKEWIVGQTHHGIERHHQNAGFATQGGRAEIDAELRLGAEEA